MSAFALKLIALAAMLIDHCAIVLTPPHYALLRGVGRIAFPLFSFLIAEGYAHTRSPRRYLGRLLLFALISQIPFALVVSYPEGGGRDLSYILDSLNVFFTLAGGLSLIMLLSGAEKRGFGLFALLSVTALLLLCLSRSDYGYAGALLIVLMYFSRSKRIYQLLALLIWAFWQYALSLGAAGSTLFAFALLSGIPMLLYNGRRGCGAAWAKWLFYAFYPAHLLILGLIKIYIL